MSKSCLACYGVSSNIAFFSPFSPSSPGTGRSCRTCLTCKCGLFIAISSYVYLYCFADSILIFLHHENSALRVGRELAQYAFTDPSRVIAEDLSHSGKEKRYYCFGRVGDGIMTVRFTYRGNLIRIFGAGYWRKGRKIYEEQNQIH